MKLQPGDITITAADGREVRPHTLAFMNEWINRPRQLAMIQASWDQGLERVVRMLLYGPCMACGKAARDCRCGDDDPLIDIDDCSRKDKAT